MDRFKGSDITSGVHAINKINHGYQQRMTLKEILMRKNWLLFYPNFPKIKSKKELKNYACKIPHTFQLIYLFILNFCYITTIFVDMQLWKTKHSRKRFQNFRQSYVLLTDQIEIHQSQPLPGPSNFLYVLLVGCDWWISIRHVDNMKDWRKFWKRFRECFVFQSRVSTKTVVSLFFKMFGDNQPTFWFKHWGDYYQV